MTLDRPPMIRTDASNPFAHHTMTVRVPKTIDDILNRNPDYPGKIQQALEHLKRGIQNDDLIPMLEALAPDYMEWKALFAEGYEDDTWLNTDWFFAEPYFYRLVIQATRWWETARDPFAPNKREEYASDALWTLLEQALTGIDETPPEERLHTALGRALWGNRIDLSYAESRAFGTATGGDDLLVDDSPAAVRQLLHGEGAVHIVTDNAGTELTMDLVLVDALLETAVERVILHVKMHPTFVSDAIPADVWGFLAMLDERGGAFARFGGRLRAAFDAGRLRVVPDLFWNSSRPLWNMPSNLKYGAFWQARMVIIKGDANYRRMVGDALWVADTPFAAVLAYFPAPLLALRTLKSDPVVGLAAGEAARLDGVDERWRYNGKRGLMQFKP